MTILPLRFALWALLLFVLVKGDEDVYEYDDNASKEVNEGSDDGVRLVGASRGNVYEIPFIVGYSLSPLAIGTSCTGSLITRQWILSAAHCIINLVHDKKYDDCVHRRNSYKSGHVTCAWLKGGNLRININPHGVAYLGVVDANDITQIERGYKADIDYVVKHNKSYLAGGTYGNFGGYDVALVHVSAPVPHQFVSACLPGPDFTDSGIGPSFPGTESANLAGFGKFRRPTCLTDGYGPSKYHNCVIEKHYRRASDACRRTLAPTTRFCQRFMSQNRHKLSNKAQDVIVIDAMGVQNYCHRRVNIHGYGWCNVTVDASVIGTAYRSKSWGFCSKDCFDDYISRNEPSASVLRMSKGVDILPSEMCDRYLEAALKHEVEVRPEILCVGHLKKINYVVYREARNDFIPMEKKDALHKILAASGLEHVVHSAGTCNGDSGGPVFIKHDNENKYVVLGVVSGGRGILSNCGGMNNPTHYARVKKFGEWIQEVLGPEQSKELCFVEN